VLLRWLNIYTWQQRHAMKRINKMTQIEQAVKLIKEMFPELPNKSVDLLARMIDLQLKKLNK
jgi:hypothetical protein